VSTRGRIASSQSPSHALEPSTIRASHSAAGERLKALGPTPMAEPVAQARLMS